MGIISRPNKPIGGGGGPNWVAGADLYADELDDDMQNLYDEFNGKITNANCSASMALEGTKLANSPSGIPSTKYNDKSVTADKIANDGATDSLRAISKDHIKDNAVSARSLNETIYTGITLPGTLLGANAVRFNTGLAVATNRMTGYYWERSGAPGAEALAVVSFELDTSTNTWWVVIGNPNPSNITFSSVLIRVTYISD
jgi:hypothetical protein